MGSSETHDARIDFSALTPVGEVAQRLQDIVNSLHSGTMTVQHGNESIVLQPSDTVEMRLQARQKARAERLTIELNWRRTSRDGLARLTISDAVADGASTTTAKRRRGSTRPKSTARKTTRKKGK